jgi:hypothetical protein
MTGLDSLVRGRRNWLRLPELRLGEGGVVDFLHDQVASGAVLLHGSNSRTIERFEPLDQTSYHGVLVHAVFATPDPVWPLFFAVTDTGRAGSRCRWRWFRSRLQTFPSATACSGTGPTRASGGETSASCGLR